MDFSWCAKEFNENQFGRWRNELENKNDLSINEKLLRALLLLEFRSPLEDFDRLMESINTEELCSVVQRGQFLYLLAAQKRSFNKIDEALDLTQEGYLILKEANHPLQWFLKVQLSSYYYELKKFHFAAECCHEVVECSDAPVFALSKAYENLGIICLLIGHYSSFEKNFDKYQSSTQHRLRLHQELVAGKTDFLTYLLKSNWSEEKITVFLALEIVLGVFYYSTPELVSIFNNSDIKKFIVDRSSSYLFSRALHLLDSSFVKKGEFGNSWVESLWVKYFEFLMLANSSMKELAIKVMVTEITPFFSESHFFNPLMPHLVLGRFYPDNSISSLLEELITTKKSVPQLMYLEIHSTGIFVFQNGRKQEVRLDRSAVSLNLLRILSGPAGKKTKKESLHRQLSLEPYDAFVHDSRIYKLLTRLRDRLKVEDIPELWSLPGDNTIEILCDYIVC